MLARDLPRQHPRGERAPRDDADAFLGRQREVLALDRPDEQVVLRLERHESAPPVPVGERQRLHQPVRPEVRRPDVKHLPGAHEVVERAKGLLERRPEVLGVDLVQIDVVGTEAAEARVARLADVLARRAPVVRARAGRHRALRREHDRRPPAGHRLAADLLGDRAAVRVRRVDEVAAGVEEAIDQPERLGLVAAPVGHAEGHGAEAEVRDAEAAPAEGADAHVHRRG